MTRAKHLVAFVVVAALASAVMATPAPSARAASGWVCGAYDQTAKRGRTPQPDGAGRVFPVVTIHGISGSDNDFDRLIDKSYNEANPKPPRSLFDALAGSKDAQQPPPGLPGVRVFSFSYTPDSLRWVDNTNVGGKFAQTLDCLYAKFHEPVSIVAHSMGGLVARWVANTTDSSGVSRARKLGKVITLGTPYLGSVTASVISDGVVAGAFSGNAGLIVALLTYLCGRVGTSTGAGSCLGIPGLGALDSDAGRNLRYESAAIRALRTWPAGVDVTTLAGSIVLPASLFGSAFNTSNDVGDLIVTKRSATADPRTGRVFSCRYDSVASSAWTELQDVFHVADPADRHAQFGNLIAGSPCYHSNLMRNVELTNEVLGSLNDWLSQHRAPSIDFKNFTYPAGTCSSTAPPITVRGGEYDPGEVSIGPDNPGISVVRSVRGDLDRDGKPEWAVLLDCSLQYTMAASHTEAWIFALDGAGARRIGEVTPVGDRNFRLGEIFGPKVFAVDIVNGHISASENVWVGDACDACASAIVDSSWDLVGDGLRVQGTPRVRLSDNPDAARAFLVGAIGGFDTSAVATPAAIEAGKPLLGAEITQYECVPVGTYNPNCTIEVVTRDRTDYALSFTIGRRSDAEIVTGVQLSPYGE